MNSSPPVKQFSVQKVMQVKVLVKIAFYRNSSKAIVPSLD